MNKTRSFFFYISFCPFRILYNSKFILMATFLGSDAVIVTRVHHINLHCVLGEFPTSSKIFGKECDLCMYLQLPFLMGQKYTEVKKKCRVKLC